MRQQDIVEAVAGVSLLWLYTGAAQVLGHAYHMPLALYLLVIFGPAHVTFKTLFRRIRQRRRERQRRQFMSYTGGG